MTERDFDIVLVPALRGRWLGRWSEGKCDVPVDYAIAYPGPISDKLAKQIKERWAKDCLGLSDEVVAHCFKEAQCPK